MYRLKMKAVRLLLLAAITLPNCHSQTISQCDGTVTELYQWIDTSSTGEASDRELMLSCANVCPEEPNDSDCSPQWYLKSQPRDYNFGRTINLTIRQNSSSCGYYYCRDGTNNATLKSALVLPTGHNPVCENLGTLSLCQNNQRVRFSYNLFLIDEELLDHPCELLKNDQPIFCDSNECQVDVLNFSSSYSFQCSICEGHIIIKSQIFHFQFNQIPICSDMITEPPISNNSNSSTTRVTVTPSLSPVDLDVIIYGPTEANIGSNVSINCTIVKGHPPPDVSIITPQGTVVNDFIISFSATLNDSGNYTCIANNTVATIARTHSLIINGKDLINSDGNEKTNDNDEVIAYVVIGVIVAVILLLLLILIVCYTSLKRRNVSCVHLKDWYAIRKNVNLRSDKQKSVSFTEHCCGSTDELVTDRPIRQNHDPVVTCCGSTDEIVTDRPIRQNHDPVVTAPVMTSAKHGPTLIIYSKEHSDDVHGLSDFLRDRCQVSCDIDQYHMSENIPQWAVWVEDKIKKYTHDNGFILLICSSIMFQQLSETHSSCIEMKAGHIDNLTLNYLLRCRAITHHIIPVCLEKLNMDVVPCSLRERTIYTISLSTLFQVDPNESILDRPELESLRSLVFRLRGESEISIPPLRRIITDNVYSS